MIKAFVSYHPLEGAKRIYKKGIFFVNNSI